MPRRVTTYSGRSVDHEPLQIITVYEEGINKEAVKQDNCYTKKHEVLIQNGDTYEFMG